MCYVCVCVCKCHHKSRMFCRVFIGFRSLLHVRCVVVSLFGLPSFSHFYCRMADLIAETLCFALRVNLYVYLC